MRARNRNRLASYRVATLAGSLISVVLATTAIVAGAASAANDDGSEAYALSRAGDSERGRRIFGRCRACHNLDDKTATRTGPNLDDLFGRLAGSSASYVGYSKALKESGIIWTEAKIENWLNNPRDFLPGNKMALAPILKRQDRLDLIAYLRDALTP